MIYEAVIPVLNEIDAATYARVHKATSYEFWGSPLLP